MRLLWIGLAALAFSTCLAVVPAEAIPIEIVNPSFEDDVLFEGGIDQTPTAWITSAGGGDGAFHPLPSAYPGGLVPDGENVGYANEPGNRLQQVLTEVLQPSSIYTLQVEIGRRLDVSFVGYRIQLWAGGVMLAEENAMAAPAAGEFETAVLELTTGANHPQLGEALEIVLLSQGTQTNFDDVRLDRSPVPPPAPAIPSLGIVGIGILAAMLVLLGLAWLRPR